MCRKRYKIHFVCENNMFMLFDDQPLEVFSKLKEAVTYAEDKLKINKPHLISAEIIRVTEERIKILQS